MVTMVTVVTVIAIPIGLHDVCCTTCRQRHTAALIHHNISEYLVIEYRMDTYCTAKQRGMKEEDQTARMSTLELSTNFNL